MSLWTGHLIPGSFDGVALMFESSSASRSYRVVEHSPANFVGGFQEPMGAAARTYRLRACFPASYFEAHKLFMTMLDAAVVPLKPAVLIHPVYGEVLCYPVSHDAQVDFGAKEAVVDFSVRRHYLKPEILPILGSMFFTVWPTQIASASGAGYAVALAFAMAFQAQLLQAALTLLRAAGSIADYVENGARALGEFVGNYAEHFGDSQADFVDPSPASGQEAPPPAAGVRAAFAGLDDVTTRFIAAMNISAADLEAIATGATAYDGGQYHNGKPPVPGVPQPSPRFQAALVVVGLLEAATAGHVAAALATQLRSRSRLGTLEGGDAEAALAMTRRRLARGVCLAQAALGTHAPGIVRELSKQGAQLLTLGEQITSDRAELKTYTVKATRPLRLLAIEIYGDAHNAAEYARKIRALNKGLRADFNRLPPGTVLTVPAA